MEWRDYIKKVGIPMAYAVSLFFDEPTTAAVRHAWTRMAEAGVSSLLSNGPYCPHLTLAIYS